MECTRFTTPTHSAAWPDKVSRISAKVAAGMKARWFGQQTRAWFHRRARLRRGGISAVRGWPSLACNLPRASLRGLLDQLLALSDGFFHRVEQLIQTERFVKHQFQPGLPRLDD